MKVKVQVSRHEPTCFVPSFDSAHYMLFILSGFRSSSRELA